MAESLNTEMSVKCDDPTVGQGSFMEGNIPPNMFMLQDDVFISSTLFKGMILIHVRRYKKYGTKYYPTKEGITLSAYQYVNIISNNYLREKSTNKSKENPLYEFFKDLPPSIDPVFVISSNRVSIRDILEWHRVIYIEFNDAGAVLTKEHMAQSGQIYINSVTLNNQQWDTIFGLRDTLMDTICDILYNKRENTMESVFEKISGRKAEPTTTDDSGKYSELLFILKVELYKCLAEKDLLNPYQVDRADMHHVNTVQNFNCAVITLKLMNVMTRFYDVVKDTDYMPYVNQMFFKSVNIVELLQCARNDFIVL